VTRPRQAPRFEDAEQLVEQLRTLMAQMRTDAHQQQSELGKQMQQLEVDARDLQQLLQASERQAGQLANLYVATYQLHASLELEDVQRAIGEIAINLLGAQEYALLLRDEERQAVDVAARSAGAAAPFDADHYGGGDALVDAGLADGVVRLGPAEGSTAIAAVPLVVHGTIIGALVLLRLLPQKAGLGIDDRELLDVLAAHAASALLAARMFQDRTRKLRTLESLMELLRPPPRGGRP
jgi:GAF domain